eukprot:g4170.t1
MASPFHATPTLQYLFSLRIKHSDREGANAATADFTDPKTGRGLRVMPITGGSFVLPGGLAGTVLKYSAADWMVTGKDGHRLNVRLVMKCDDGVFIYMRYEGHAGKAGLFGAPFFETDAPEGHPARALTKQLVVMVGKPGKPGEGLEYDLYVARSKL